MQKKGSLYGEKPHGQTPPRTPPNTHCRRPALLEGPATHCGPAPRTALPSARSTRTGNDLTRERNEGAARCHFPRTAVPGRRSVVCLVAMVHRGVTHDTAAPALWLVTVPEKAHREALSPSPHLRPRGPRDPGSPQGFSFPRDFSLCA